MCKLSVDGRAKGEGSDSISRCPELTFTLDLACNATGPVASTVNPVTTLRLVLDSCLGTRTHTHHMHTHTYTTTTHTTHTHTQPPPHTRNTHTTRRDPTCLAELAGSEWRHDWHTHTHSTHIHTTVTLSINSSCMVQVVNTPPTHKIILIWLWSSVKQMCGCCHLAFVFSESNIIPAIYSLPPHTAATWTWIWAHPLYITALDRSVIHSGIDLLGDKVMLAASALSIWEIVAWCVWRLGRRSQRCWMCSKECCCYIMYKYGWPPAL